MISLLITIALIGLLVWALITFVPMPDKFKTAIIVVAIVCVIIYVLSAMGATPRDVPVPQVR